MDNTLRTVEVLIEGTFQQTKMSDLKINDVIRVTEPDGDVIGHYWDVLEDPTEIGGVWGVVVLPHEDNTIN